MNSLQPLAEAPERSRRSALLTALGFRRHNVRPVPWLLALPGLAALIAFHFVPIGFGAYYAFTSWNGLTHAAWVGLRNFRDIAQDATARGALFHTLELAGCFVVAANAIGLALALGLNSALKTRHLLRSLFFAPVAISPVAIGYLWSWIFDYEGALNRLLGDVGLSSLKRVWLGDPSTALWTALVVMVWQFSGLAMVLYLAGLQGISEEIYEATLVDGASPWFRFRKVVLPLLAPAFTVSATITLVIGMRAFDQIKALTDGGPAGATETLATQVYRQISLGRYGYGSAFALLLAGLVATVALLQLALLRRNEERL